MSRRSLCASVLLIVGYLGGFTIGVVPTHNYNDYRDYDDAWRLKPDNGQRSTRMFPYGSDFLDNVADRSTKQRGGLDPRIDFSIPYYGNTYQSIWISTDAFITFNKEKPSHPFVHLAVDWPNDRYPILDDPPMIAVFYSKSQHDYRLTDTEGEPSGVYYRSLVHDSTNVDPDSLIMNGMLDSLSSYIQTSVVGGQHFKAKHGIIVTWDQVTFKGGRLCITAAVNCKRNTYQLALVTDSVDTYTVVNYYNVTWIGGVEASCDPDTGGPGGINYPCPGAQVGFNAGAALAFTNIPRSGTQKVLDLDIESGDEYILGRYSYKVSGDFIVHGGCTNILSLGDAFWPLQVSPGWGGMFGGAEVNVSGPCFTKAAARIKCRFGDVVTDGTKRSDVMHATCNLPPMKTVGQLPVAVSVDGGANFYFKNTFTVGVMSHLTPDIKVSPLPEDDWKDSDEIRISWRREDLSWSQVELVDITILGYREIGTGDNMQIETKELYVVAKAQQNSGYYTIWPDEHQCGGHDAEIKCLDYDVGAIQVSISITNPQAPRRIWSDVIPLGWFTKVELQKKYGPQWPHEKCAIWHSGDLKDRSWWSELWPCPCTLQQALVDFGRFHFQTDCNIYSDGTCHRHHGAVHCIRSTGATPHGSGTQCCYDERWELMYAQDQLSGSTADRSHAWGAPPYNRPPFIPTVSHYFRDIIPLYQCCTWQDNDADCFERFITLRGTPNCKDYKQPGHAGAFGDPHFRTFDGTVYTYNGKGEYWLVKVVNAQIGNKPVSFSLQGRQEQPQSGAGGEVQATVLTSVAMKESERSTIEVRLNPNTPSSSLHILMDGQLLDLTQSKLKWRDFTDVLIVDNTGSSDPVQSNYTIVYRSGIGVQVAAANGLLHVITALPPEFFGKTKGLFGKWNGVIGADLIPSDDDKSIDPNNLRLVHYNFGNTWAISQAESLFKYRAKLQHGHYLNMTFVPKFEAALSSTSRITSGRASSVCGNNFACRYDISLTQNENIARHTLSVQEWLAEMAALNKPVPNCGWLDVPMSIKQEPISYLAGSVVRITGCRAGYKLEGATVYTCTDHADGTATWLPAIATTCQDESQVGRQKTRLAVAIAVPVGIVLIIGIIGLTACACYVQRKRKDHEAVKKEVKRADELAKDEFSDFTDFPSVVTKAKPGNRPARPLYRQPQVPISESIPDSKTSLEEAMDLSMGNNNVVHGHDQINGRRGDTSLDESVESSDRPPGGPRRPRPYQYPRNTDTTGERRKAPYKYPNHPDL